jgi:dTDP-4-dehydrorhamnose reductase
MTEVLVLGATGMVGQAIMRESRERGLSTVGAARSEAEVLVDVTDDSGLINLLRAHPAATVINCAAVVSHADCEAQPDLAYRLNARCVAIISETLRETGGRLVHISTDQFFAGDGRAAHDESAPVRMLNEYGRSKYAGEQFALTGTQSLVVRTNVTGFRGDPSRPTFVEWAIKEIESGRPMELFDDFFTSTIDAPSFASALLDIISLGHEGLINVASSEVASKEEFILALARAINAERPRYQTASISGLQPPRGGSLGLDVSKAEGLLGRRLPILQEVVEVLAEGNP